MIRSAATKRGQITICEQPFTGFRRRVLSVKSTDSYNLFSSRDCRNLRTNGLFSQTQHCGFFQIPSNKLSCNDRVRGKKRTACVKKRRVSLKCTPAINSPIISGNDQSGNLRGPVERVNTRSEMNGYRCVSEKNHSLYEMCILRVKPSIREREKKRESCIKKRKKLSSFS